MRMTKWSLLILVLSLICMPTESFSLIDPQVEAARQRMLQEDRDNEALERNKEMQRYAHKQDLVKRSGFIAISDKPLVYKDAVNFCKKHGGRLPKINDSKIWDGENPPERGIKVDGFGYGHRPFKDLGWSNDMGDYIGSEPVHYWTDTSVRSHFGLNPWFVFFKGIQSGRVEFFADEITRGGFAVCVPND